MSKLGLIFAISSLAMAAGFSMMQPEAQKTAGAGDLDRRVRQFLDSKRWSWHDMNVPEADGQALYNIILKHGYKNALEMGTSTGHSGIWIAWALSKTGGKLVTIEIDRDRHNEALANFREAGVAKFIDARLDDAHKLVPALPGPFDFVFCDADKDWYKNYLSAVLPKMTIGGCFAAHNISERSYSGFGGRGRGGYAEDFLEFARSFSFLETTVLDMPGSAGMSVSYKKAEK